MGAFKDVAEILTEPGTRRAVVDLLDKSISGLGRIASKAKGGAESVDGLDLAVLSGFERRVGLPTERVTAAKPTINPDELISRSVKTIGHDRIAVSETTRQAHVEPAELWKNPDRFSMGEVQSLVYAAQRTSEGVSVSAVGDHATSLQLSQAGSTVYKSAPKMEDYLRSLKGDIRNERWNTIIADDVSGRIPGLVVWDQAQRWSYHRGTQSPSLLFMASGHSGVGPGFDVATRIKNLAGVIEENRPQIGSGRVLVVTDLIDHGGAVGQFNAALSKQGIKFDVASMLSWKSADELRDLHGLSYDVGLHKGTGTGGLYAWGAGIEDTYRTAIGVEKYGAEALSRPNRRDMEAVKLLRDELNPFSRFMFERVFQ